MSLGLHKPEHGITLTNRAVHTSHFATVCAVNSTLVADRGPQSAAHTQWYMYTIQGGRLWNVRCGNLPYSAVTLLIIWDINFIKLDTHVSIYTKFTHPWAYGIIL